MRNHGLRKGEGCSLGYGNIQLFKRLYCIQIGKKLVVTFCFSSGQLRRFCSWTQSLCFGSWIISKKNSGDLKEEEILEQGNYFIMELKKRVFFLSSTEHSLRVFHLDGVMRGWKFSLHFSPYIILFYNIFPSLFMLAWSNSHQSLHVTVWQPFEFRLSSFNGFQHEKVWDATPFVYWQHARMITT